MEIKLELILPAMLLVHAAAAQAAPARIRVLGVKDAPVVLSAADLKGLKRHTVHAVDHGGQKATFEGWLLGDVLGLAGIPRGKEIRGPALARYILATAADGYKVVFTLAELDPGFTDKVVLLADARDGKPLSKSEGPFRVVVPDEKRPARWIRQVISFEIKSAPPPSATDKSK